MLFGRGALAELAGEIDRGGGTKVVLVASATLRSATDWVRRAEDLIGSRRTATFSEVGEHTPDRAVRQLQDLLEQTGSDCVVSFGGGSVIDGVKAALHGRGAEGSLHLAVPTTLSGAEFTPTAGVTDTEANLKRGLRDVSAAPRVVLLDPEVTAPTPQRLWLATGIRALDHAVETIWAPEDDPITHLLAARAIVGLRTSLPACRDRPDDLDARERAQLAAWCAALGLAGSTMGPSHQLGRLLGATFGVPHGITSCLFLPPTIEWQLGQRPELVRELPEPFGVESPDRVGRACRDFISGLGLPTDLQAAGLDRAALGRFLEMVPQEWHPIVRAAVPA